MAKIFFPGGAVGWKKGHVCVWNRVCDPRIHFAAGTDEGCTNVMKRIIIVNENNFIIGEL